jgi:hypothetical protein
MASSPQRRLTKFYAALAAPIALLSPTPLPLHGAHRCSASYSAAAARSRSSASDSPAAAALRRDATSSLILSACSPVVRMSPSRSSRSARYAASSFWTCGGGARVARGWRVSGQGGERAGRRAAARDGCGTRHALLPRQPRPARAPAAAQPHATAQPAPAARCPHLQLRVGDVLCALPHRLPRRVELLRKAEAVLRQVSRAAAVTLAQRDKAGLDGALRGEGRG